MKHLSCCCSLAMCTFLEVSNSVNGLLEPPKKVPHVSGVSVLLIDFKKEGCYFYIKTAIDLLSKRIKSCINVEKKKRKHG